MKSETPRSHPFPGQSAMDALDDDVVMLAELPQHVFGISGK
jgi:hypothetical protein